MDKLLGTNENRFKKLHTQIKWEFFDSDEYFPGTAFLPTDRPRRRGGWRGILRRLISIQPATIVKEVVRGEVGLLSPFDVSSYIIKKAVRVLCWWNDGFIGDGFFGCILNIRIAILYGLFLYSLLLGEFIWME